MASTFHGLAAATKSPTNRACRSHWQATRNRSCWTHQFPTRSSSHSSRQSGVRSGAAAHRPTRYRLSHSPVREAVLVGRLAGREFCPRPLFQRRAGCFLGRATQLRFRLPNPVLSFCSQPVSALPASFVNSARHSFGPAERELSSFPETGLLEAGCCLEVVWCRGHE